MSEIVLKINDTSLPTHKITAYKSSNQDLDKNSGRNTTGYMYRKRIRVVKQVDVTFSNLTDVELKTITDLIKPKFISVTFTDMLDGCKSVTKTMYVNSDKTAEIVSRSKRRHSTNMSLTFTQK